MLEIVELFKAFKILHANGIDINQWLTEGNIKGGIQSNTNLKSTYKGEESAHNQDAPRDTGCQVGFRSKLVEGGTVIIPSGAHNQDAPRDILTGNTLRQLEFLSKLAEGGAVSIPSSTDRERDQFENPLRLPCAVMRDEGARLKQRGLKGNIVKVPIAEEGGNVATQVRETIDLESSLQDRDEASIEMPSKKLEDFTLAKILSMKEDVEEIYGASTFQNSIFKDMAVFFGVLEPEKPELDKKLVHSPVVSKKKSFLEALVKNNNQEEKIQEKEEDCVPLKPLAIPRLGGGNSVVEIDDEEYYQGVEELKYSVIGNWTLR